MNSAIHYTIPYFLLAAENEKHVFVDFSFQRFKRKIHVGSIIKHFSLLPNGYGLRFSRVDKRNKLSGIAVKASSVYSSFRGMVVGNE